MHFFPEDLSLTINNRFNLDQEANIPTWYSTVLLFLVSMCSLTIYFYGTTLLSQSDRWRSFWILMSSVYCFLSLDEAARLHELIDKHTSLKWVYVYAPFGAIFFLLCVFYLFSVRNNDRTLRIWLLGGLLLYATGGLFAEYYSYYFGPLSPILQQVEFVLEEGLEVLGTIMVLMACFTELNQLNADKGQIH
jgi:hypothetical protein